MAHPNEELLREAAAAFQRGDMEALQNKYFAPNIRYHVSGRSAISGDYEGIAQVLGLYGRLFELSGGTVRVEVHDVVANDAHAILLFSIHAERGGRRLDANEVLITHPGPDGKVAEAWAIGSDPFAAQEFWS